MSQSHAALFVSGHTFCFECISRLRSEHLSSKSSIISESLILSVFVGRNNILALPSTSRATGHRSNHGQPSFSIAMPGLYQAPIPDEPRCPTCRQPIGLLGHDTSNILPNYALISVILENKKRANKALSHFTDDDNQRRPTNRTGSAATPESLLSDTFCGESHTVQMMIWSLSSFLSLSGV